MIKNFSIRRPGEVMTKQREGTVHQLQQVTSHWPSSSWTCLAPRIRGTDQPYADRCSHCREDVDWKVGYSATKSAYQQAASRAGSALRMGCIVERIAQQSGPRSYWSVSDLCPSSTRIEQRWASVSKRKIWINPLVLPARLCCASAGNSSHSYVGKVCCLLLVTVRADYIRQRPLALPRGHWELLKLLLSCSGTSSGRLGYVI